MAGWEKQSVNSIELMANLAEIFGGLAVIFGIGFGLVEYRRSKTIERREAAASLARSFQTQEFTAAIRLVMTLPNDFGKPEFEALPNHDKDLIWFLFGSMESIGILVYRGDLQLSLVDEFFSIPITEGWRKLMPYVEELRQEFDSPQTWEWFQWLYEHLVQHHQDSPRVPAHIKHRN
jgi:hypothetical protein